MAVAKPTKKEVEALIKAWKDLGGPSVVNTRKFGSIVGKDESTVRRWLTTFVKEYKIDFDLVKERVKPSNLEEAIAKAKENLAVPIEHELKDKIRGLETLISSFKKETLDDRYVRSKILGLAEMKPDVPGWLINSKKAKDSPGVPTLLCSDWHWGEVIDPTQVNGKNEYNLEIAQLRARSVVNNTIDLLNNHLVNPNYPGIVLALGGDMVSGDIHEELSATNEKEMMPVLLDLYGVLIWVIKAFADKFGKVFVPCVTGNHGRNTKKIRAKGRTFTSFDWLLYQFLDRHFHPTHPGTGEHLPGYDDRVQFMISAGPDVLYHVYNRRYLLTHGDQFRGGDALIGALGPIVRGDHRKRARNMQIDMSYDTIIMGHWHQLMQTQRFIVNGCFVKGSLVTTDTGIKEIQEVKIGDKVLSRDGTIQKVTNLFNKKSDKGLVHLKVRGLPLPLSCTPNHLVWAIKSESKKCDAVGFKWDSLIGDGDTPQWIPADFISPKDYIHVPRRVGTEKPITEEQAWMYGIYLAEGWAIKPNGRWPDKLGHSRIHICMHRDEEEFVRRFQKILTKTYKFTVQGGRNQPHRSTIGQLTHHTKSKAIDFSINASIELVSKFREMFGHLCYNKKIPDEWMNMTPKLSRALIQGWIDGDGNTTERMYRNKTRYYTTSATTTSKTLAYQMFQLSLNSGYIPSMTLLKSGGPRKADTYTISFRSGQETIEVDGELFYRVHARYRDTQKVKVYDLEVSGEHTYTVNGIGVHNSLCGYNEYCNDSNFPFEEPKQALWITHPERGITFSMPILVSPKPDTQKTEWVGWATD